MAFKTFIGLLVPFVLTALLSLPEQVHGNLQDRLVKYHVGALVTKAGKAFECYKAAHGFRSSHRGGKLWNTLKKLISHYPPNTMTTKAARLGSCLTWVEALKKPLKIVRQLDKTVFSCSGSRQLSKRLLDVHVGIKTLIMLYSHFTTVKPTAPKAINMTALRRVARNDAANILLASGRRGVAPKYLVNLEVLDLVEEIAKKMKLYCIPTSINLPTKAKS